MRRISLIILSSSIFAFGFSCNEENKTGPTNDVSEEAEKKDSAVEVPVHIPIDLKYEYDSLLNDLLKITFEPRLFGNVQDAKIYFDEMGLSCSVSFSPEESITTLWTTLETSDKKNHLELNYHYQDEDGDYIDFRNIISKIEDVNRKKTEDALIDLSNKNTLLKGRKFKKDYGEKGYVWYEEGTGQAMQTIVSIQGGTTDWIEIRRCNYFFVTEKDLIE